MTNLRLAVSDGVPVPDREAIRDFLSGITPIHIASISPEGGPAIGRYFGDDIDAAADYAISANDEGRNVYWTPNEPTPDCGSKPTKGQIRRIRFAYVDIDPPKDDRSFDKVAVAEALIGARPSFVIDSGNGVQAFWRLAEPLDATAENAAAIESINRRIAADFDGDPSAVNSDRLMRLPGTVNYPNVRKRERGRVPCMASVLLPETGRGRPSLAQLVAHWPVPSADAPPVNAPVRPVERPSSATSAPVDAQTLDDLRDALQWLNADDRGAWVRHGHALKPLGESGFRLWDEHSRKSASYDHADALDKWASFNPTAIDYRAIFSEATARGWRNPGRRFPPDIPPDAWPFNPATITHNGARFVSGVGVVQLSAPAAPARKYALLDASALKSRAPLEWLIKGVLPARGFVVIYGASGSGKSFLAINVGGCLAEGTPWFGYRTKPRPVVYLGLEGEHGIRTRILAWERKNGRGLPNAFHIVLDTFKLTNPDDIRALAEVCPKGSVIIVDTLARAGDDDPNDPKLRARCIEGALALQGLVEGVVVVIAHTGKDETRGIAGMKSIFDAADGVIAVSRTEEGRRWIAEKVKDGSDGAEHAFDLGVVFLGVDGDGDPVTSCTVEPVTQTVEASHRVSAERHADDLFVRLFADHVARGDSLSASPNSRWYAPRIFAARPGVDVKEPGFKSAMTRLMSNGRLREIEVRRDSKSKTVLVLQSDAAGSAAGSAGWPLSSAGCPAGSDTYVANSHENPANCPAGLPANSPAGSANSTPPPPPL